MEHTEKLRCLIVDDEPVAIDGLAHYIGKTDFLEVARTCFSAIEAREILRTAEIDLMFLDINMPQLSGIDFLESIENAPLTILTTAYSEYALEGYRLNVVDYLLKPIGFQRFLQAAQKAQEVFQSKILLRKKEEADIVIRHHNSHMRIATQDILYVEGMQNYVKIHCKDKNVIVHQTMTSIENRLSKTRFFRIHRSYLVNLSHIGSISGNTLSINEHEIPVSAAKRQELLRKFGDKKK